jgi:hypothetical protein
MAVADQWHKSSSHIEMRVSPDPGALVLPPLSDALIGADGLVPKREGCTCRDCS